MTDWSWLDKALPERPRAHSSYDPKEIADRVAKTHDFIAASRELLRAVGTDPRRAEIATQEIQKLIEKVKNIS